jgi:hypothetical protein
MTDLELVAAVRKLRTQVNRVSVELERITAEVTPKQYNAFFPSSGSEEISEVQMWCADIIANVIGEEAYEKEAETYNYMEDV